VYKKFILGMILSFGLAIMLAGCTKDDLPKPETTFSKYVKAWKTQNYSEMYALLSKSAKADISEDQFVNRYKDIYGGIEAQDLKIAFDKPKEKRDLEKMKQETLTYHVKMNTIAGPITFSGKATLTKVNQKDKSFKWTVNWKPDMILPGLKEGQFIRVKTIPSERGEIVDTNGNGLAINGEAVQIGLYPKELEGHADTKARLAKLLHIPESSIEDALSAGWVTPESFVPVKTVSALNTDLIDQAVKLPGVLTQKKNARVYPCGAACSHLIGYVGTITKEELDKNKGKGYNTQSLIGKRGLEQLFENQLRGIDGAEIYIADENGNPLKTIAKKQAKNGEDIQLTIDADVQKTLYDQLKKDTGTAVAINPKTGEVLGLVSTPAFDPNQFILGMTQSEYNQLVNNPGKPLLNRFTAKFPPGSSIKPLISAIGLETGAITPDTVMKISGKTWKKANWKGDFHITRVDSLPKVNLRDALVYSDNIYFARLALSIGKDPLINGLKDFGFGKKLPFAYPMETSQIANNGTITSEAMLANTGYGQGEIEMNPLHLALTYTAFVNNGNIIKPQLIKKDSKPEYWLKNVIPSSAVKTIHNDLVQIVSSPEGTAYNPRIDNLPPLAGKTGTAELKEKQGEKGKEDGWFVAFNTNQPSLEIAMMIEGVQDKGGSHYVVGKVKNAFHTLLK